MIQNVLDKLRSMKELPSRSQQEIFNSGSKMPKEWVHRSKTRSDSVHPFCTQKDLGANPSQGVFEIALFTLDSTYPPRKSL